jgi:hypothetical protein
MSKRPWRIPCARPGCGHGKSHHHTKPPRQCGISNCPVHCPSFVPPDSEEKAMNSKEYEQTVVYVELGKFLKKLNILMDVVIDKAKEKL